MMVASFFFFFGLYKYAFVCEPYFVVVFFAIGKDVSARLCCCYFRVVVIFLGREACLRYITMVYMISRGANAQCKPSFTRTHTYAQRSSGNIYMHRIVRLDVCARQSGSSLLIRGAVLDDACVTVTAF